MPTKTSSNRKASTVKATAETARTSGARAAAVPTPPLSQPLAPAGRINLIRIEEIHRQLCEVTPTSLRRVTIASLAKDLELSPGPVREALNALAIFNAPLKYDGTRRTWFYAYPYKLRPPLWLPERQMLALAAAIRFAAHSRVFPLGPELVNAWGSLSALVAGGTGLGPGTLDGIFSTSDPAASEAEAHHFAVFCEAIARRREVKVVYRKVADGAEPETRIVHPLHWYIRPDACLLVVHESRLGQRRNFELVRIQSAELTDRTFAWPDGFDLKKYLAGAFGRFVGEAVCDVQVRVDRDYVPFLRERPWQDGQVLHLNTDGSADVVYSVCHTADLEQNVLRAGGQVEAIGPPEVRARIHAAALRLANRHGGKEEQGKIGKAENGET